MKPILRSMLLIVLCVALAGCGPEWKKKFVRKRAEKTPEQVFVYEPKDYQREPNEEIYKRSFIFWKSWMEELVNRLGDNRVNDLRSFEEVFKNLGEMKNCLAQDKGLELEGYKKEIEEFYNAYKASEIDTVRCRQMRQDLNRWMLRIDKIFRPSRTKQFIRKT